MFFFFQVQRIYMNDRQNLVCSNCVLPPSNSVTWRFSSGSPTKNVIILVVTGILVGGYTQMINADNSPCWLTKAHEHQLQVPSVPARVVWKGDLGPLKKRWRGTVQPCFRKFGLEKGAKNKPRIF